MGTRFECVPSPPDFFSNCVSNQSAITFTSSLNGEPRVAAPFFTMSSAEPPCFFEHVDEHLRLVQRHERIGVSV